MKTYSIKKVAAICGTTQRALRHFEDEGLLRPARSENGYRAYTDADLDRIYQVLLYRELDMPLADIAAILDAPGFNAQAALEGHRAALAAKRARIDALLESLDQTIESVKKGTPMSQKKKFEAFKAQSIRENEERYGEEVRKRWGDDAMDGANAKAAGMSEAEYSDQQQLAEAIIEQLKRAFATGDAAGEEAAKLAQMHKDWLCRWWPDGMYSPEAHKGLADGYVADERFTAYYDGPAGKGAAQFLRDAIHANI